MSRRDQRGREWEGDRGSRGYQPRDAWEPRDYEGERMSQPAFGERPRMGDREAPFYRWERSLDARDYAAGFEGGIPSDYRAAPDQSNGWVEPRARWAARPPGGSWEWGIAQQRENFTGRGPKGYQRSDERLKELVSDRLTDDPDVDATNITVDVKNGEVTISGTVSTREQKRRAEECIERVSGVREVLNQVRVSRG